MEKIYNKTPNTRRAQRIFWVVTVGLVAVAGLLSFLSYKNELKTAEKSALLRLEGIARSLALQTGVDAAHEYLIGNFPNRDAISRLGQDTTYDKIHRWLRQNWESNMLKSDIYTMSFDSARQKFYFVATSGIQPYFKHDYHIFHKCLVEKYHVGGTLSMYSDEHGTWISAFAPIKNAKGETVAVVMADEPFDYFIRRSTEKAIQNLLFSLILVIPIVVLVAILVRRMLLREAKLSLELEKSLEALASLNELRREMIANISHDLRTPLASISGYIETIILKSETIKLDETQRFLHIALQESRRLRVLIDDLFELSKLESNQIQPSIQPFPIGELAHDIVQKYELVSRQKNILISCEGIETPIWVEGDLKLIDRLLQNLLDNAIRYNLDEGGKIMFRLEKTTNQTIQISVENTGKGIDAADLPLIFDRYFKKSAAISGESTGLGLAIVKKIIDLHNTSIQVESQHGWTKFQFQLPIWEKK